MKKIILIAFAVFLLTNGVFAAEVENLVSKQVGNRVVFEFDIVGEEKETDVSISLTINGKTYTAKDLHLEGDYGEVKVGKGRKIYWNVLRDFPRGHSGSLDVEIVAGSTTVYENALRGVRVGNLTPDIYKKLSISERIKGVVVTKVESGSPVNRKFSKLLPSDVIMEINRKATANIQAYKAIVLGIKPDESVLLLVSRRGSAIFITVDNE